MRQKPLTRVTRQSVDYSFIPVLSNRKISRLPPPRTLHTLLLMQIWTSSVHLHSSWMCPSGAPFSGYSSSFFPASSSYSQRAWWGKLEFLRTRLAYCLTRKWKMVEKSLSKDINLKRVSYPPTELHSLFHFPPGQQQFIWCWKKKM